MNQRAAQGLRQVHDGTFAQNLQSEVGPRFEGGGELDGVGTCSRKRPAHPADQPKRRGCAPHHPPRSSNLPTEPRSSNLRTEMPAPILPPETDRMFAQWQSAKRARDYVTADKLREELRQLGVDADLRDGRPSRGPGGGGGPPPVDIRGQPLDSDTDRMFQQWQSAKRARDFGTA